LILGLLPQYMKATATPLHPQPESAPSVAKPEPLPRWSEAVGRARQTLRAGLAGQNIPGLSVAVGVGGEVVWAEGFGWADVAARVPVTPDKRFRIGTASRVLTSAAVGVLLEKDQLKLDDQIQTYVPRFPNKAWPVTLRQVMGHVAGVATDGGDDGPLYRRRCERPSDALQYFADGELLFEPGTQYDRYSNYGWILASAAVEAAAEQPFLTFMREQIFRPLGMRHTGAESSTEENPEHIGEPSEDPPFLTFIHDVILLPLGVVGPKSKPATPDMATYYSPRFGTDAHKGLSVMRAHNLSCYAGAMAFFSTPSDLVRFGLAINNGTLLKPATVQLLQTSQRLTSGKETGYGLGWQLENITLAGKPAQAAGHDGELRGGQVASLMTFRERGIVVAVMSNISHADTSTLALKVAEAFAAHSGTR
jgi:serine beta-lactamase-like protein LACTB